MNQDSNASRKPSENQDITQPGPISSILSAITDGLSSYNFTTNSYPQNISYSPSLFQTLTPDDNMTTGSNMSSLWSDSTSQWTSSMDPVAETSQLVTSSFQTLVNGTDPTNTKSTYFTNMMTWFIATGAVVAAVILLGFINCCIENRNAIKKLLGLSKPRHPHQPVDEKRVRRDFKSAFEKSDDHDYQVHLLWSRFASYRPSTRKEQSHI